MRTVPIVRSRTGCFTCRRRKKKCNEEKPLCSGCRRNHLQCTWPTLACNTLQTRVRPAASTTKTANAQETPSSPAAIKHYTDGSARQEAPVRCAAHSPSSSPENSSPVSVSPTAAHTTTATTTTTTITTTDHYAPSSTTSSSETSTASSSVISLASPFVNGLAPSMSLLPSHGLDSSNLLAYYLTRTANSMGNGSTDINPFISKLVPIAFSNPLVLQLLLAQSASHRQSAESGVIGSDVALCHYIHSLRMFHNAVGEYVLGKEENALALTVGSLILCLTEVARGDVHGTIFNHLRASDLMLHCWLVGSNSEISGDLPDFLVEFAIHMTATSIMSTDPKRAPPDLSPTVESIARSLIAKGYVGQLSGCWLELLLLIPQVYRLGRRVMAMGDNNMLSCADDVITFGLLQSQIMAFSPSPAVNHYSRLAGLVFKQGVLLYLWSILGTTHGNNGNVALIDLMSSAVAEAVSLLGQIPATLRINTSLCWPLTVIGSCTTSPEVQQVLRERLQIMYETIGLGNMKETLVLVEHLWTKPPQDVSPWKLTEAMRERQVWISFA